MMPETYYHEITFERTSKYFVDANAARMYDLFILFLYFMRSFKSEYIQ